VELLSEHSLAARCKAIEVLGSLGPAAAAAVPALRLRLKDPSDLVQRGAALALGEMAEAAREATGDLLVLQANCADPKTYAIASTAIEKINPVAAASHALVKETETAGEVCCFFGHRAWVHSVALSPSGQWALSGAGQPGAVGETATDFSVRLWDIANRREQACLMGHAERVTGVAFFPDGEHAISGSYDSTLRIWDLQSCHEVRCLRGHLDRVTSVAISPDGRLALSGSCDRTLRLWDVAAGRALNQFEKHAHWVVSVAFSADGRHALSGGMDGSARLWDIRTGREQRTLQRGQAGRYWFGFGRRQASKAPIGTATVTSVAFDPAGRLALSGSTDKVLRLWNTQTGETVRLFQGHAAGIKSVAFSADGRRILSGGIDRTVRLWDVESGGQLHCFEGHTDAVTSVVLTPRGDCAISGSADKTIRLWRLPATQI
jgi:WD40 repeat protein